MCGLFTMDLYEKSEFIRKFRNKIHPYALKKVDDKYTKTDINEVFSIASEIIDRIENF